MEKEHNKKEKTLKYLKPSDFEGIRINYQKKKFEEHFPNLTSEISKKKQTIKIDSVRIKSETNKEKSEITRTKDYREDIRNPGVIDFIRRCKNKKEAIEILDFLLKRREINTKLYKNLKKKIEKKNGLAKLIAECGGLKKPGYYERKYYSDRNL